MQRQTTEKRFWSKVEIGGLDECWPWTGRKHKFGYGAMMFRRKIYTAHRLAYLLVRGEFDEKLDCCHRCDNPPCCNPLHLFLGTAKDNITDAINKGRFAQGQRNGRSRLTSEQVEEIKKTVAPSQRGMKLIARRFGISKSCLYCIVHGRTWKHI